MKMETLLDVYIEELRDLYDAENQLLKALPKMAKAATSAELKSAFDDHLDQTQTHVSRLEQVFEKLGEKPKGKKCEAMKGLLEEARQWMEEDIEDDALDVGLIVAAQKVEHYEIAGYGSVRTFAESLGRDEESELLQETLDEEKEADDRLTELAESSINLEAMGGESSEEEEEPAQAEGR